MPALKLNETCIENCTRAMLTPRRHLTQVTKSKARRNLFGPVDHEELRQDWEREMSIINQEASRKWNFDFKNEKPLPGRYIWKKEGEESNIYRKKPCKRCSVVISENTGLETDKVVPCMGLERPKVCSKFTQTTDELCTGVEKVKLEEQESLRNSVSAQGRKRQRKITEFYSSKKSRISYNQVARKGSS